MPFGFLSILNLYAYVCVNVFLLVLLVFYLVFLLLVFLMVRERFYDDTSLQYGDLVLLEDQYHQQITNNDMFHFRHAVIASVSRDMVTIKYFNGRIKFYFDEVEIPRTACIKQYSKFAKKVDSEWEECI